MTPTAQDRALLAKLKNLLSGRSGLSAEWSNIAALQSIAAHRSETR